MAEDNTQFMTSVLQKLNNAKQVSQSNNLTNIVGQQGSQIPKPKQPSTNNKNDGEIGEEMDRNGWQRFWDTTKDVSNKVAEGFFNVFDFLFDAGAYVVGLMGDDNFKKGVEEAMNYDWQAQALAYGEKISGYTADIMTGDMLTPDYWTDWGKLGNAEESRELINQRSEYSYQNDTAREIEETIGSIVPSLILAYFTGGSSIGVQAASQGALAFGTSFGAGVDQALNEGADYYRAGGYGAVKGAESAAITSVMVGVGGSVASKGGQTMVDKAANKVFEKTGSLALRTLTKAGVRGASAYLTSQINTLTDPVVKQIYDDGNALAQAYGSNERVMETLRRSAENGLKAATVSATITAVQEGISTVKAGGVDKYKEQIYSQIELSEHPELMKSIKEIGKYNDKRSQICKDLANGKITEEQFTAKIDALDKDFETVMAKYEYQIEQWEKSLTTTRIGASQKDNILRNTGSYKAYQFAKGIGANADIGEMMTSDATRAFKEGKTFKQWKYDFQGTNKGQADIVNDSSISGALVIHDANENQFNLPAVKVGNMVLSAPTNTAQTTAAIIVATNNTNMGIQLPTSYIPNANVVNLKENTPLVINAKALQDIIKNNPNYSPKDIVNALKTLPKANMVSEVKGNELTIVGKSLSDQGTAQFNVFVVNAEDNSIKSMVIADKMPENVITVSLKETKNNVATPNNIKTTTQFIKSVDDEITKVVNQAYGEEKAGAFKIIRNAKVSRYNLALTKHNLSRKAAEDIIRDLTRISFQDNNGEIVTLKETFDLIGKDFDGFVNDTRNTLLSLVKDTTAESLAREKGITEFYKNYVKELKGIATEIRRQREQSTRLVKNKEKLRVTRRESLKWTHDEIMSHATEFISRPINAAHKNSNGTFKVGDIPSEVKAVLNDYVPPRVTDDGKVGWDNNRMPYNQELQNLYIQLDESFEGYTGASLNSRQMELLNSIGDIIKGQIVEARKHYDQELKPVAGITSKIMSSKKTPSKIGTFISDSYFKNFLPRYQVMDNIFGGTAFYVYLVKKPAQAISVMDRKVGDFIKQIADKQVELGLMNKTGTINKLLKKRTVTFPSGAKVKVTNDSIVNLFNLLRNGEDYQIINECGLVYDDGKKTITLAEPKQVEQLKDLVDAASSIEMIKYADYLYELDNGQVGDEYDKGYQAKFHTDSNRQTEHWSIDRVSRKAKSSKVKMAAYSGYGKAISRVKNKNPVLLTDATAMLIGNYKGMVYDFEVYPYVEDCFRILNTDVTIDGKETTLYYYLGEKYGNATQKSVINYLNSLRGISAKDNGSFPLTRKVMHTITTSKLSLKPSTMVLQLTSMFNSNITVTAAVKGFASRVFKVPHAMEMLQVAYNEAVGGAYKYRKGTASSTLTGGDQGIFNSQVLKAIEKIGMYGISTADDVAVSSLVVGLGQSIENTFGYKYGSPKWKDLFLEHLYEVEASQISKKAAFQSAASSGDLGPVVQMLTTYMKGPMRAMHGNINHKLNLWVRNKGKDYETIKKELETLTQKAEEKKKIADDTFKKVEETQKKVEEAREKLRVAKHEEEKISNRKNPNKEELNKAIKDREAAKNEFKKADFENKFAEQENSQAEEEYSKAKGEQAQKEYEKSDFESYKFAGGKGIIATLVGGILAFGGMTAIIRSLDKKLKGQEKWNEWKIEDLAKETAINSFTSWLPIVSEITNYLQGYDLEIPALSIFTDAVDYGKLIYELTTNYSEKTLGKFITASIDLASSMSGIPFGTLSKYIYGAVATFDPETGVKLHNVFYTLSSSQAMKNFHEEAKSGNETQAISYLKLAMEDKVGNISDKLAKELYRLYNADENVVPRASMVSYTDANGNEVTLSDIQKNTFVKTYSKANNLVDKLIKSSYYKSLDDSQKSYAISYVYNTYYAMAKGNITKEYESKASYVMAKTNGKVDISITATAVSHIKGLENTEKKSRKDQALAYVNSLKCEKGMKYLILKLAGFGLDDKAKDSLKGYLIKNGMSSKDAKDFVK